MQIKFTVPAVPIAQPRPRATAVNGRARVFEAKAGHAVHSFKATVRQAARAAYDGPPLTGPLILLASFVFPRPKGMIWKTRPMPRVPHAKKPDADNLQKSLLDALNGLCFVDDSQVYYVTVMKFIASGDEQPHVAVKLQTLSPQQAGG